MLLFLLFVVGPILEISILLQLKDVIGGWETIGLVVVTGAVGAALAKHEGRRMLTEYQRALQRGEVPEEGLVSGVLLLMGGVMLVTPGVITDVLGLAFLIPPIRRAIARGAQKRIEARMSVVQLGPGGPGFGFPTDFPPGFGGAEAPGGDVIDVEATVKRDDEVP